MTSAVGGRFDALAEGVETGGNRSWWDSVLIFRGGLVRRRVEQCGRLPFGGESRRTIDPEDGRVPRGLDLRGEAAAVDGVVDAVEGEFASEEVEELA